MISANLETQTHLLEKNVHQLEKQGEVFKSGKKVDRDHIVKAAKNFESFMTSFMFKEMYNAIPRSDVMGDTEAQNMFMGLYMDEVTKRSSTNPNGIASQIVKQYERYQDQMNKSVLDETAETQLKPDKSLTKELKKLVFNYGQNQTVNKVYKDFDSMIAKLENKISSDYGMRTHPILKKERMHNGIDLALDHGADVKAPSQGKVVFAGNKGGYGNAVVLDHGFGVQTMYAHLSSIGVKEGQILTKDDLVGQVGSTGMSTGPHLHFEVLKDGKPLNPRHLHGEVK